MKPVARKITTAFAGIAMAIGTAGMTHAAAQDNAAQNPGAFATTFSISSTNVDMQHQALEPMTGGNTNGAFRVQLVDAFNSRGPAPQNFAKYRCFRPRRISGYECYYKIYSGDKPAEGSPRYEDLPPTRGNMNDPGIIGPVSPQDLRNMGLIP